MYSCTGLHFVKNLNATMSFSSFELNSAEKNSTEAVATATYVRKQRPISFRGRVKKGPELKRPSQATIEEIITGVYHNLIVGVV